MNRRTFLAATLLTLLAPRDALGVTPIALPSAAIRAFETIDAAADEPERIAVRGDRLTDDSPRFPLDFDALVELGHVEYLGAMRGEYYVGSFEAVPAPGDLPSSALFVDFVSTAGVAAFRQEHTLGMVDNERVRWTIQATGGASSERIELVTDLALLLVDRRPADDLPGLLPQASDFPFQVRLAKEALS